MENHNTVFSQFNAASVYYIVGQVRPAGSLFFKKAFSLPFWLGSNLSLAIYLKFTMPQTFERL